MHIIGLTGGIACGKSSVSDILAFYGATVIDIDQIAHKLSEPDEKIFNAYISHFGERILSEDGTLDRRSIADIIYNDPNERAWINETSHPILHTALIEEIEICFDYGVNFLVLEIPLLFEAGWEDLSDENWVVILKRQLQIKRLMRRDKLSRDEAKLRIDAQMSQEDRIARADVVINNSEMREVTRDRIAALLSKRNLI